MKEIEELRAEIKRLHDKYDLQLLVRRLDIAIDALREIMKQGTGSQGNSVEATIAYETLGKLGEI